MKPKSHQRTWLQTQLALFSLTLLCGFCNATSTGVAAASSVTSAGSLGLLVSLGIETVPGVSLAQARVYYRWIAFGIIMLIGFWVDQNSSAEFCLFGAAMSAVFWWFGWLTTPVISGGVDTGEVTAAGPIALIVLCVVLAVAMYFADQKKKNFGVQPTGDTLINIVMYLMVLQASIALINGVGLVPVTAQAATPSVCGGSSLTQSCYLNGNTQLTNLQSTTVTGNALTTFFDMVSTVATMGWSALVGALQVVIAVIAFPIVIQGVFPWVAQSAPALALLSIFGIAIWVVELLMVFRWIYKPMPGDGRL